jgi:hypothetical protein
MKLTIEQITVFYLFTRIGSVEWYDKTELLDHLPMLLNPMAGSNLL